MALKQLQVVTWAKSQHKQELFHEQHEQDAKGDELIATHNREISKIQAKAEKEIDKMTLLFQEDTAKWKEKLADKQENQWARMHEQHNTTFR